MTQPDTEEYKKLKSAATNANEMMREASAVLQRVIDHHQKLGYLPEPEYNTMQRDLVKMKERLQNSIDRLDIFGAHP